MPTSFLQFPQMRHHRSYFFGSELFFERGHPLVDDPIRNVAVQLFVGLRLHAGRGQIVRIQRLTVYRNPAASAARFVASHAIHRI